jgi:hypothetical protein
MPNPHLETKEDGKNFQTPNGGCRPSTPEELKKIKPLDPARIAAIAKKRGRTKGGGDFVAAYNAAYWDENQGGTGCWSETFNVIKETMV